MAYVALPFGDLIETDELTRFEANSPCARKRIYTPKVTLKGFLSQVVGRAGSCQEAVNVIHLESTNALDESCSLNTSSYTRARMRLSLAAVKNLAKEVHQSISENIDESCLWKNRRVSILDGSSLTMADTPENIAAFPKRSSHKEYSGYPLARFTLVGSLETGAIIDFKMAGIF